jgi:hypothetical protein
MKLLLRRVKILIAILVLLIAVWIPANVNATCFNQLGEDGATYLSSVYWTRYGERFNNQPVSTISSISLLMYRYGSLSGTATCTVRAVSDDSLIGTLGSIAASSIGTSYAYYTFNSTSVSITTVRDIRILLEYSGGDATKRIVIFVSRSDSFAGAVVTGYLSGAYTDTSHDDLSFKNYCYTTGITISTLDLVLKASVSTVDSVAFANVKSLDSIQ